MKAGPLRHRGTIQHLVTGSPQLSASGESLAQWTALAEVWMSIEPLRGRELFAAQEHQSETEVRIRIRYRDDVTTQMRVLHDSKYYSVLAVIDSELRHRELELMCTQGVIEQDG